MKRTLIVLTLVLAVAATVTSCAAQKGGCKSSQGYVGYGNR
ncbi:MAG TPA: hypothetical protein VD993_10115 [Chitinophagaceae bacterium]|nr:hypothetical protein [Chitinophagaceae bacterium]